jgi:hypothetical protein
MPLAYLSCKLRRIKKLACKSVFSNGMRCTNFSECCQKYVTPSFIVSVSFFLEIISSRVTVLCITRTSADAIQFSAVRRMRLASVSALIHRDSHLETIPATTTTDYNTRFIFQAQVSGTLYLIPPIFCSFRDICRLGRNSPFLLCEFSGWDLLTRLSLDPDKEKLSGFNSREIYRSS